MCCQAQNKSRTFCPTSRAKVTDSLLPKKGAADSYFRNRGLRAGKSLAGPPSYEGALLSDGSVPEAARAFIRFLASAEARAQWVAAKLEPLADR
jgi:ABC-type molybdate transport system substrate-binding protein